MKLEHHQMWPPNKTEQRTSEFPGIPFPGQCEQSGKESTRVWRWGPIVSPVPAHLPGGERRVWAGTVGAAVKWPL